MNNRKRNVQNLTLHKVFLTMIWLLKQTNKIYLFIDHAIIDKRFNLILIM